VAQVAFETTDGSSPPVPQALPPLWAAMLVPTRQSHGTRHKPPPDPSSSSALSVSSGRLWHGTITGLMSCYLPFKRSGAYMEHPATKWNFVSSAAYLAANVFCLFMLYNIEVADETWYFRSWFLLFLLAAVLLPIGVKRLSSRNVTDESQFNATAAWPFWVLNLLVHFVLVAYVIRNAMTWAG
jgi:hypothetical protein